MNRRESIKAAFAGIGAAVVGVLGFGKKENGRLDVLANHVCTEHELDEVRSVMPNVDDMVDVKTGKIEYLVFDGQRWVRARFLAEALFLSSELDNA